MAKNVMKMLKPSPTLGRNAFDMSHRSIFAANAGELIPSFLLETVPNDKIQFKASDLLRAAPMITSPFLRAKQHIDFWFVPYQALWSRWNDFIVSRSEPSSSRLQGSDFVPHVKLKDLCVALYNQYTTYEAYQKDIVGMDYLQGACRLLDMLGYDSHVLALYAFDHTQEFRPNAVADVDVNLFRLAAYNYIWYKEYRQQYYDDGTFMLDSADNVAHLFNFDYLACTTAANSAISVATNFAKTICAMSQMRYRTWKKDLFTGLLPSTQFGNVSIVDIDGDIEQTFNVTGTGNVSVSHGGVPVTVQRAAIWDVNGNNVVGSGNVSINLDSHVSTPPYPESVVNQSNLRWGAGDVKADMAMYGVTAPVSSQILASDIASKLVVSSQGSGSVVGFDILSLRRSEAIQLWRERALRAGNQIEDNYEAHFGSKPHSHMISHPTYIGSFDSPLNISDVNATAETNASVNGTVGSVAGKGISSMSDKEFTFQTNDFGVIVGLWSLLPESEYESKCIHRNNQLLEQFDFFMPEFENLGLEAVSTENFFAVNHTLSPNVPTIMGYAPRYYGYKTELDKVHYGFFPEQSYHHWVTPKYDIITYLANIDIGNDPEPLSLLYVNPKMLDTIFVSGAANERQFIVDMFNDITAIRSMSVSGMPGY